MPAFHLPAFESETILNVIIDTPQGSNHKYHWDESLGLFTLKKALSLGSTFPFNFGFIPQTRGEDGDPLDILVLSDGPAPVGCRIPTRVLGVLQAEQTEEKKMIRNDRILGAAVASSLFGHLRDLSEVDSGIIDQIEHFFISYNVIAKRTFRVIERAGPAVARRMIRQAEIHESEPSIVV